MAKYTVEDLKNLKAEDLEISEAGPRTPVLAMLQLTIAQTYLLEMMKAEGTGGCSTRAYDHVRDALEILEEYEAPMEH